MGFTRFSIYLHLPYALGFRKETLGDESPTVA